MIGRLVSLVLAGGFALMAIGAAIGLIALDLLGATFFEKLKFIVTQPRTAPVVAKELQGTKDITFFKSVKVDGRPYSITMGIAFETPEDLAAGKQKSRWCYCTIAPKDGGVPRQIELATQEGANPPRYRDLSAFSDDELKQLGESQASLSAIARKHCRFTKEPGGAGTLARRFTTIVLKGEQA